MFNFLIIVAFVIRLVLMPISAHDDLFFINYYPNRLLTQGLSSTLESNVSYYPPLTLYTLAFFQSFYHFFSGTFSSWMVELYRLSNNGSKWQADTYIKQAPDNGLYKDIFLAKFPYLLFDLATVFVIWGFVKKKLFPKSAILLWLFNPVLIYSTYIFGQFEIIPAFFVFLGFCLLNKNLKFGLLTLGIAAAFKNYAFLFILPTAIIYGNNWSERLKLIVIATAPYILFLSPTIFINAQGAIYALFPKVYLHYKPLVGWPLYSQLIKYLLLVSLYLGILFLSLLIKTKDKWRTSLGISFVSALLVLAIGPRISFHYLLWATPLVILWFHKTKTAAIVIIVQTISLASFKLLANHLQAGLFAPINPDFYSHVPTFNSILNNYIPYKIISAAGFFIFLFFNLYIASKVLIDILFKFNVETKIINSSLKRDQK